MRTATRTLLGALTSTLLAALVLPPLLGLSLQSAELDGGAAAGSVVVTREVPTSDLRQGDIVLTRSAAGIGTETVVARDAGFLRTDGPRGDADLVATVDVPTSERVVASVPYLGHAEPVAATLWPWAAVVVVAIGLVFLAASRGATRVFSAD